MLYIAEEPPVLNIDRKIAQPVRLTDESTQAVFIQ